ncbi:hypothetical protein SDC9_161688 [bioreactor metagenome]|uniref:Uncharacterized protein n=1 Tax=bioreactor metagenome TaxID=1076179 RepID=A0A645FIY8_9ZZZZ
MKRCPTLNLPVRFAPTLTTLMTASCPGITGSVLRSFEITRGCASPARISFTSEKQSPIASIRTRSSSGPICGTGMTHGPSFSPKFSMPAPNICHACIFSGIETFCITLSLSPYNSASVACQSARRDWMKLMISC